MLVLERLLVLSLNNMSSRHWFNIQNASTKDWLDGSTGQVQCSSNKNLSSKPQKWRVLGLPTFQECIDVRDSKGSSSTPSATASSSSSSSSSTGKHKNKTAKQWYDIAKRVFEQGYTLVKAACEDPWLSGGNYYRSSYKDMFRQFGVDNHVKN